MKGNKHLEEFRVLERYYDNLEMTQGLIFLEEETKTAIQNKADLVINLQSIQYQVLQAYYPIELLIHKLKELSPSKIRRKSYFSNLHQKKVHYLKIEWQIASMTMIENLFGNAFQERYYGNSRGEVNFREKKGGFLVPRADEERKLGLSYNTLTKELLISFYYERKKAFLEGDQIVFKTVI